jgi:uncharacterized protein YoxC
MTSLTEQLDVLTKQLDQLTNQLEVVNSEYTQLCKACEQKEKEQDQLFEAISQMQKSMSDLKQQNANGLQISNESEKNISSTNKNIDIGNNDSKFIMYGEGLLERVLGLSYKYDVEEDEEPKEIILPPLDKKMFPALAALQEKHPIILKRGPNPVYNYNYMNLSQ